jgi:hypothetical protein
VLYKKPENRKPALGKMPEWLNDESVDFLLVFRALKQTQAYDGKNKAKIEYTTRKFSDEFIIAILSLAPTLDDEFDKKLLTQIEAAKPLRDLFFDYIEALLITELDSGTVLGDFFEKTYNGSYIINGRNSCSEAEFEFSRFIIWEMFIGTMAILINYEKYKEIYNLLYRTYFLTENPVIQKKEANNYTKFRHYFGYIEERIKPKSNIPNNYTLAGDIAVKREKQPLITEKSLNNADIILYQLSCVYEYPNTLYTPPWFPTLYVYCDFYSFSQPLWSMMVSNRHCEKLFPLFGVTNIKQLKSSVEKSKPDNGLKYSGDFHSAASIQRSIMLDDIGTMP